MVGGGRWILVVEDEAPIRETLVDALESEGHVVRSAENGQEGLRILNESPTAPCMMLLDLMMPIVSGWQLLAALKQEGRLYDQPIIVLSAAPYAEPTLPPGIGFLAKPFDLTRVLDAVSSVCTLPAETPVT